MTSQGSQPQPVQTEGNVLIEPKVTDAVISTDGCKAKQNGGETDE